MRQTWQRISAPSLSSNAPQPRLYLFPHAGGSRFSYAALAKKLHGFCELFSVEYPDLEISEIAKRLADEYSQDPPALSFFMGHSMGALVAYETLLCLRSFLPKALLVSACAAPSALHGPPGFQNFSGEWTEEALLHFMKSYGVLPKIFEHQAARDYFFALLKKDLKILRKYRPSAGDIPLPIHAFYGEQDLVVRQSDIMPWQALTKNHFSSEAIAGGHLYPLEEAELLAIRLKAFMSTLL